ncbi:hypothetical protein L1987_54519 [Smallanthus sonchifolius]|uniref:Uncharacterized protein n=1 Tax=Smallanthus sonchifolius TaxID=185202 RepID=A0ACB9E7T3_9ASTR|nr:hypothetical protein L1987_54519 [Smallanthus sonchifolius]
MEFHEKGPYYWEVDWQVLVKKAEKFESKELQKIIVNWEQLLIVEKLLNDAYVVRRPKPSAYEHRKQVIRVLNDIAKELYGNSASCPVVEEFGSFSMDLFTTESDLDLSINFRNSLLVFPRDQKIKTLRKFAKKLYSLQSAGRVQKVETVMRAKVPILKFVDTATHVECDISVENMDGISKSLAIRFITSIDERFQKLSLLMKAWAKAHDINSPKDQTLNSLSIILLVAFHLQTRDPPILPPFSAILKDGEDPASVKNSVRSFQNYGRRNTETLGELFVSFLIKLASVEDLWQKGLCASPYLGHWTSKTWNNKIAIMSVEDFMDRTQNVARTVGNLEVNKIYDCIRLTIESFRLFMNVKIEELQLKELIFGIGSMHHPRVEPRLTMNSLMDLRAGPNRSGHRGVQQHQAVTAGPEIPWARQSFYNQPMMGMRVAEGMPATQRQGSALGGPGWGGGASTGSSVRANGAAFMDDHNRWSQEVQPATDPWGRRLQQTPYGNSSNARGSLFR